MNDPLIITKFQNALTDILREITRCPDDSIQDIANEMLEKWEINWHVDSKYIVEKV